MKTRTTLTLAGKSINVDQYPAAGPSPAKSGVVVAYGTEGMNSPFDRLIDDVCEALARAGYLTVLPYYFESTGTTAGLAGVSTDLFQATPTWINTLADAVSWTASQVTSGKVALVGFSLGGNQALNAALQGGAVGVVDYFGPIDEFGRLPGTDIAVPMPTPSKLTSQRVATLPPTLIHHGMDDHVVPDSQSKLLKRWLDARIRPCTLENHYPCGHPGQRTNEWDATAQSQSIASTIAFLKPVL